MKIFTLKSIRMWYLKVCYSLSVCISECKARRGREWGQISLASKQERCRGSWGHLLWFMTGSPIECTHWPPPLEDQATLLPLAAWIATETHRHQRRKVLCTICCPTIFQPLGKKYKTLFPFLLATMLMSAKAVHCSFFVCRWAKMHTMIIHFCLCKKSSSADLSGGFRAFPLCYYCTWCIQIVIMELHTHV